MSSANYRKFRFTSKSGCRLIRVLILSPPSSTPGLDFATPDSCISVPHLFRVFLRKRWETISVCSAPHPLYFFARAFHFCKGPCAHDYRSPRLFERLHHRGRRLTAFSWNPLHSRRPGTGLRSHRSIQAATRHSRDDRLGGHPRRHRPLHRRAKADDGRRPRRPERLLQNHPKTAPVLFTSACNAISKTFLPAE